MRSIYFPVLFFVLLVPTTSFLDLHRHRHPHFHDMMNASDCCNIWKSTFYALHQAPPRPRLRLPPAASPPSPSLPKTAVKMEKICGISWGLITIKTLFCKKMFFRCLYKFVCTGCLCVCVFFLQQIWHIITKLSPGVGRNNPTDCTPPTDWHGRGWTTHRRR